MRTIHKHQLKVLKQLGGLLPQRQYQFHGRQKVTGEDAILAGHKEIDGKEIDPEENYIIDMPYGNTANHTNRLKSAFKRNGIAGVCKYLRPYYKPEKFSQLQVILFKALK